MFSAPMDWGSILQQMEEMAQSDAKIALPHVGAVLATKVELLISSGLVSLNRLVKQATVRRHIIVQLIRMLRDARHPDYLHLDMSEVAAWSKPLADDDEPSIPKGLAEFLDPEDATMVEEAVDSVADKAARPA